MEKRRNAVCRKQNSQIRTQKKRREAVYGRFAWYKHVLNKVWTNKNIYMPPVSAKHRHIGKSRKQSRSVGMKTSAQRSGADLDPNPAKQLLKTRGKAPLKSIVKRCVILLQ